MCSTQNSSMMPLLTYVSHIDNTVPAPDTSDDDSTEDESEHDVNEHEE